MAGQGKTSKKARKTKVSKGIHGGGGKVRLTELQKALMGGGVMRRVGTSKPYKSSQTLNFEEVQ